VKYFRDSPQRAHSRSSAIKIAEVEMRASRMKKKNPRATMKASSGDGNMVAMEERDGGVYIQAKSCAYKRYSDGSRLDDWPVR